jgi:TolA-binding protein
MTTDAQDPAPQAEPQDGASDAPPARVVPVGESIRYRRRAQQAEGRAQQLEQQLNDLQSQLDRRADEVAKAEAQRDEAHCRLTATENRLQAERLLGQAGVVDLEAASLLLSKRVDLAEGLEPEALSQAVEQLLLDKPFLRVDSAPLPPSSAAPRAPQPAPRARLAQVADRAARSGNPRDVAEYLRLKRQASNVL